MRNFLRLNSITAAISMPDDVVVKPFQAQSGILITNPKWGNLTAESGDFQAALDTAVTSLVSGMEKSISLVARALS